ncbi:hypothetical protein [Nocardia sp. CDC160]|uniref:hypothetical protein n=1 Tax=Nocardia sp. CDC160 TaxID=3112166 RepID=UPI002DBB6089|nr:hypothetical protein [Nocardia sp. CDC160]MEC3913202.1 hypothetical protein [Nocardia sp. CDC160]
MRFPASAFDRSRAALGVAAALALVFAGLHVLDAAEADSPSTAHLSPLTLPVVIKPLTPTPPLPSPTR